MAVGPAEVGRSPRQDIFIRAREGLTHCDRGSFTIVFSRRVEDFADTGRVAADIGPVSGKDFIGTPSEEQVVIRTKKVVDRLSDILIEELRQPPAMGEA